MIEITRLLARQLRAVLRKAARPHSSRDSRPPIVLQAGPEGRRIHSYDGDVGVQHYSSGSYPEETIVLPAEALDDFESSKPEPVTLTTDDKGNILARWFDAAVPQVKEYATDTTKKALPFPTSPDTWTDPGPGFLKALDHAFYSTALENPRYALTHLQLRATTGEIVATDGRQLLIQTGLTFPWKGNLLVPARKVFGARELNSESGATIGMTDAHLGIQVGPWTLLLSTDKSSRYPAVDDVIPRRINASCHLGAGDIEFLARSLSRLPGAEDDDSPVTIDLNERAFLRAKAAEQSSVTELVLSQSLATGKPCRLRMNRKFLARAVELGLSELHVADGETPVVFEGNHSQFVVMPLNKDGMIPPTDGALRIESCVERNGSPHSVPKTETRRTKRMADNHALNGSENNTVPNNGASNGAAAANGHASRKRKPKATGIVALIDEADALKAAVRDIFSRSHNLLVALKKHRKQSKTFQAALTSLKQLQHIEA